MKAWKKLLLLGFAMTASAATLAAPAPGSGLVGTAHDFATGFLSTQRDPVTGALNATPNTVGLCTYCHTPHAATSQALLWNHSMSANVFSWDEAKTAGGTPYATMGLTYKGPTAKCLSCHDGSVAIGDVALFQETPRTGAAKLNTFLVTGDHQIASSTGKMTGSHPVGMPYPYQQSLSTYNGTTTGGDVALAEFVANPHSPNTGTNSRVKLFQDNGGQITAGIAAGKSGIECSSCHDPHNKQSTDDTFLRGKVAGSAQADGYLCLQCTLNRPA